MTLAALQEEFDTVLAPRTPSVRKLNNCLKKLNEYFTALAPDADNAATINLACYVITKILEFPTNGICRALKIKLHPHLILQALNQPLRLINETAWTSSFLSELKGAAEARPSALTIIVPDVLREVTPPPPAPIMLMAAGNSVLAFESIEQKVTRTLQAFAAAKDDPVKLREFFSGLGNPRKEWTTGNVCLNLELLPHLLQCIKQGKQDLAEAYKHAAPEYLAYLVVVSHKKMHVNKSNTWNLIGYISALAKDAYGVRWVESLVTMGLLQWRDHILELSERYASCKPRPGRPMVDGFQQVTGPLAPAAAEVAAVQVVVENAERLEPAAPVSPIVAVPMTGNLTRSAVPAKRSRGGRPPAPNRSDSKRRLLIDSGAVAALARFRNVHDDPIVLADFLTTIGEPHTRRGYSDFNRFVAFGLAKAIKRNETELCTVYQQSLSDGFLAHLHSIKVLNWGTPSYTILQHANGPERKLYKGWMDSLVARGIFICKNEIYYFSARYKYNEKHGHLPDIDLHIAENDRAVIRAGKRRAVEPLYSPPKRRLESEVTSDSSDEEPMPAPIIGKDTPTQQIKVATYYKPRGDNMAVEWGADNVSGDDETVLPTKADTEANDITSFTPSVDDLDDANDDPYKLFHCETVSSDHLLWLQDPESFTLRFARRQSAGASTPDAPLRMPSPFCSLRTSSPASQEMTWAEYFDRARGSRVASRTSSFS
jgi:hypothetical protein